MEFVNALLPFLDKNLFFFIFESNDEDTIHCLLVVCDMKNKKFNHYDSLHRGARMAAENIEIICRKIFKQFKINDGTVKSVDCMLQTNKLDGGVNALLNVTKLTKDATINKNIDQID